MAHAVRTRSALVHASAEAQVCMRGYCHLCQWVVLLLAPGTEAKEFQPMTVDAKAGLRHDSCPERVNITAGEFSYRPALHADDMMPMFRAT